MDKLEEAISRLSLGHTNLNTKVESIHTSLTAKIDSLLERFAAISTPPHSPSSSPIQPLTPVHRHHMKLDVPRFDGSDPLGWIFKISQFFDYQGIPDQERLTVAAFYMDGPALSWYQWMSRNGFFPSWSVMLQTGTVSDYLTDFEHLANRTLGLSPSCLLSCFISGLSPELRREVQALRPLSLPQATELARLQEDKMLDRRRGTRAPSHPNPTFNPRSSPNPSTAHPKVPLKRLTTKEMATRRDQGLCYHCDDKWSQGHRCKPRLHLLIADEDLEPSSGFPLLDSLTYTTPEPGLTPQISLNAMEGTPAPQTFRLLGSLCHHQAVILVDGGSTHNFIQSRVAKFLTLPTTPTATLKVGNDHTLDCDTISFQVPLSIQGHDFRLDLYHLPLCGADIVLGVQWLKLLGPITTDYHNLTMTFVHMGQPITLNADAPPIPSAASVHQLKRLAQTQSISALFHISTTPNRHTSLLPQTTPVNVRPYRYPHFQKAEIGKQIAAMLAANLIQPSYSPFSSPILLVKKKDGSWRCCVDYRALNAVTIKDRFPMPTIDELLDDLGQAVWFSKLDLRQGFHQICMAEEDIHKTVFRTHQGHYKFKVMSFGLCNAPSMFQAAMNDTFKPFLRKHVAVFFDDILVYSADLATHVSHLDSVLDTLSARQFLLRRTKCLFAQTQLNYLGHVISFDGIAPDPEKISAMLAWPVPTSPTALHGFLGLTGFYRKFIKNYAAIASPLTSLLRKEQFSWSAEALQAFQALQQAMVQAPVLANPNFSRPFTIETDASASAMGVVLLQDDHLIAYHNKVLCPRLQRASAYIRELHAITSAVRKWRHYLLGTSFTILTDHRSLKDLMS
ncbi:uncharacterized protein LOC114373245 [Glycine soja]|uniref:uncharacterized protein LOC114373245 n=1 Tax=Glycine soja TaxID=3848 RepID=UPI00103D17E4|nr:uncharacterized protein LOC114373245 [Glycine soja]